MRVVSFQELRDLFNDLYLERYNKGEFVEEVVEWNRPHARSGQEWGTRSQRVRLTDRASGRVIAIIHRFRHFTGELRGSEKPDPKRVWAEGVWYWARGESRRARGKTPSP